MGEYSFSLSNIFWERGSVSCQGHTWQRRLISLIPIPSQDCSWRACRNHSPILSLSLILSVSGGKVGGDCHAAWHWRDKHLEEDGGGRRREALRGGGGCLGEGRTLVGLSDIPLGSNRQGSHLCCPEGEKNS